MKRFQECNWIEKIWRYRHYLPVPFYAYYSYLKSGRYMSYSLMYSIYLGEAQFKMNWYHTLEEITNKYGNK